MSEIIKRNAGLAQTREVADGAGVAKSLKRRRRRRRGLTAIEYCFMLSLVMLAVLFAVQHLGNSLKSSFESSDTKLQTYMPAQ